MPKKRDTYRYELKQGHKVVYYGITNEPERREEEHKEEGKKFSRLIVKGPIVTEETAEKWEEDRLASYRKSHRGRNPRYNKTDR